MIRVHVRLLILLIAALCWSTPPASAQANFCAQVEGAVIVSEDGDYLGKITNKYSSDSIFNEYGTYGSKYAIKSIWNEYGNYGSEYSGNSWRNKYSTTPPKLIKNGQVIAVLTLNKNVTGAVNPIVIGALCYDFDPN